MTHDPAESVGTQVFIALLELIENPADPRARPLLVHFQCASISELLRRLTSVADREVQAAMEHEIRDILTGRSLHH